MSVKTQALLEAFGKIQFHVSDASHPDGEGDCYCIASFGSDEQLSELADLLGFDEFNEWSKMDNEGNVSLDDNGCPFDNAATTIETLLEVFKPGIEEGLITSEQIRAQCRIWPYGVDRSVFSS